MHQIINITSPTIGQNIYASPIPLNFTVSNSGAGLSTCWWKNDTGNNVKSMQSKLHIYSSFWILYCLFMANDTLGNTGNASVAYS